MYDGSRIRVETNRYVKSDKKGMKLALTGKPDGLEVRSIVQRLRYSFNVQSPYLEPRIDLGPHSTI